MKKLLFLTLLIATSPAFAGSIKCENKTANLVFDSVISDGGAAVANSDTTLELDGTVLYKTSKFNRQPIINSAYLNVLKDEINKFITKKENSYVYSKLFQQVYIVDSKDPAKILFSGMVYCQQKTYVGPPRP